MSRSPLLLLAWLSGVALAHESRPLYVEITETEVGRYVVQWKVPPSVPGFNIPEPKLPEGCEPLGETMALYRPSAFLGKRAWRCPDGLAGGEVTLRFPAVNPSLTSLFRLRRADGEIQSGLLGPGEEVWRVPGVMTRSGVARDYGILGIQHILEGVDHLLFLGCLLLVARTPKRILLTITGFTLAHSVTLALAALHWVTVPVPPVEAAIALSIVFLASEIAREARDTWTYRFPITVSSSFGLLHGFGFSAVLGEIGLPQNELTTALLFFNLGVEAGQILFVGALFGLVFAGGRLRTLFLPLNPTQNMGRIWEKHMAYVIGSLAAFWMIGRLYAFTA